MDRSVADAPARSAGRSAGSPRGLSATALRFDPAARGASRPAAAADRSHDEAAAMWDAIQSIDALAAMPRHVVRAYVRSATEGWPRERARRFTHTLHTLVRIRRTHGVIDAYPRGGRPRMR